MKVNDFNLFNFIFINIHIHILHLSIFNFYLCQVKSNRSINHILKVIFLKILKYVFIPTKKDRSASELHSLLLWLGSL